MYLPKSFKVEDLAAIHGVIRNAGLATLVTQGTAGPEASHVPLLLDPDQGEYGTLYGHIARANDQWRGDTSNDALAIFFGAGRLRNAELVPDQGRERRSRADLDLCGGPCPWPADFLR